MYDDVVMSGVSELQLDDDIVDYVPHVLSGPPVSIKKEVSEETRKKRHEAPKKRHGEKKNTSVFKEEDLVVGRLSSDYPTPSYDTKVIDIYNHIEENLTVKQLRELKSLLESIKI